MHASFVGIIDGIQNLSNAIGAGDWADYDLDADGRVSVATEFLPVARLLLANASDTDLLQLLATAGLPVRGSRRRPRG